MELISLRSKGSGVYAASLSGTWQDIMGFADWIDGLTADVLEVRRIYHTDMGVVLLRRLEDGPELSERVIADVLDIYGTGWMHFGTSSRAPEQGARNQEPGARSPEPRARSKEQGTKSREQGARSKESGARNQEPGAGSPEQGARSPEPGAKSPEPGARSKEQGRRCE